MSNESRSNITGGSKRPFHLTGWGIALFSYLSGGIALPFLLWARGPKTRERRKKIVAGSLLVLGVAVSLFIVGTLTESSTDNPVAQIEQNDGPATTVRKSMPDVVGRGLSGVVEAMSKLEEDFGLDIRYVDLVSDRSVWNQDNWVVVSQAPGAGVTLSEGQLICLGIRKKDESERSHRYVFADDCPSSRGPNSWPPPGFEITLDESFASNPGYRSGDPTHFSCTIDEANQVFVSNTGTGDGSQKVGASGRCNYYQFMSRVSCSSVQVRFQWLTSIDEVIGLGTTWISRPIGEREPFEVLAFLPNSAWDKALGSVRVFEISCG